MNYFFKILLAAIQAYLSSFGNKSRVIEAVFDETKKEVIQQIEPKSEPAKTPTVTTETSLGTVVHPSSVLPSSVQEHFSAPVDKVYGRNRKH